MRHGTFTLTKVERLVRYAKGQEAEVEWLTRERDAYRIRAEDAEAERDKAREAAGWWRRRAEEWRRQAEEAASARDEAWEAIREHWETARLWRDPEDFDLRLWAAVPGLTEEAS